MPYRVFRYFIFVIFLLLMMFPVYGDFMPGDPQYEENKNEILRIKKDNENIKLFQTQAFSATLTDINYLSYYGDFLIFETTYSTGLTAIQGTLGIEIYKPLKLVFFSGLSWFNFNYVSKDETDKKVTATALITPVGLSFNTGKTSFIIGTIINFSTPYNITDDDIEEYSRTGYISSVNASIDATQVSHKTETSYTPILEIEGKYAFIKPYLNLFYDYKQEKIESYTFALKKNLSESEVGIKYINYDLLDMSCYSGFWLYKNTFRIEGGNLYDCLIKDFRDEVQTVEEGYFCKFEYLNTSADRLRSQLILGGSYSNLYGAGCSIGVSIRESGKIIIMKVGYNYVGSNQILERELGNFLEMNIGADF